MEYVVSILLETQFFNILSVNYFIHYFFQPRNQLVDMSLILIGLVNCPKHLRTHTRHFVRLIFQMSVNPMEQARDSIQL